MRQGAGQGRVGLLYLWWHLWDRSPNSSSTTSQLTPESQCPYLTSENYYISQGGSGSETIVVNSGENEGISSFTPKKEEGGWNGSTGCAGWKRSGLALRTLIVGLLQTLSLQNGLLSRFVWPWLCPHVRIPGVSHLHTLKTEERISLTWNVYLSPFTYWHCIHPEVTASERLPWLPLSPIVPYKEKRSIFS